MPTEAQAQQQKENKQQDLNRSAQQSRNIQQNQNAQQNRNIQQNRNAQQRDWHNEFWTEDVRLQETIPREEEDLSAEMQDAYQKAHGSAMGTKSRIWRTERSTKKKRERTANIKNAGARYKHNVDFLMRRLQLEERLQNRSFMERRSIAEWLDLSGSPESAQYNETFIRQMSGDVQSENEAIRTMLQKFDSWDIEEFKNPDDEQISKNYYSWKDKVQKAQDIRFWLNRLKQNGVELEPDYVAGLRAKYAFFSEFGKVLEAKRYLMESPYYALLRGSDFSGFTDQELKDKLAYNRIKDSGMTTLYGAVSAVRSTRKSREILKNPSAFLAARKEQNLTELVERHGALRAAFDQKLAAAEEQAQLPALRAEKPLLRTALRGWLNLSGTKAAADYNQVLVGKMNGDPSVMQQEIRRMLEEFEQLDLNAWKSLTDGQIEEHYMEIMQRSEQAKYIMDLLQYYLIVGGSCEDQFKARITAKRTYLNQLRQHVSMRVACMANPNYVRIKRADIRELSDAELKSLSLQGKDEELKDYYKTEHSLRNMTDTQRTVADPDRFIQEQMANVNSNLVHMDKIRSRYEKEKNDADKEKVQRAQALEERRERFARAVRITQEVSGERKWITELVDQVPGGREIERFPKAFMQTPGMTDEQIQQRARRLASKDMKERYAEYDKIFDEILSLDLSRFQHLDSEEGLLRNAKELLMYGNMWMQIDSLMSYALSRGMEIPVERRRLIWKRYHFLSSLTNLCKKRIELMATEGYGEYLPDELPKTVEEASEMYDKLKLDTMHPRKRFLTDIMPVLMEGQQGTEKQQGTKIDLSRPLEEQWNAYEAPPIMQKYLR